MTEVRCEDVRLSLELGETAGAADHLAGCESCRVEAKRLERLVSALTTSAQIEPPADVDARVRSLLAAEPGGVWLRPWLAGGLAVASFLSLVAALAVALSYTSAAEYGILLALALGTAYLALSAAAAMPLMIHAMNSHARPAEVRT